MLCLLIGYVLSVAAAPSATDTLAPPANGVRRATDTTIVRRRTDTLREIRVLGQKPLTEKKLDRTIVHVDALLANTGGHAWDVLENTPGVTLDEDGTISLNGKDGVLILIDDRPTYLSGEQLMNYLKTLPASQLEQIELLPTPPARYPAGGGAGIIIIRTKKSKTDGFQAELSSSYAQGVYPKTNHSLSLLGQQGSWQFNSTVGYSFTQNWYNSDRYRNYSMPNGSPEGGVTQSFREESWQHEFDYMADIEHRGRGAGAGGARGSTSWGVIVSGSANPYHETGHYMDGFYNAGGGLDSADRVLSHFSNFTSDVNTNAHILRTMPHPGRTLSADADYIHYAQRPLQMEYTTTIVSGDTLAPPFDMVAHHP